MLKILETTLSHTFGGSSSLKRFIVKLIAESRRGSGNSKILYYTCIVHKIIANIVVSIRLLIQLVTMTDKFLEKMFHDTQPVM
jgi:hypothetical protein